MEYNVALKIRSQLGEGIWWDERREGHFWIDIISNEVYFLKDGKNTMLKAFDDALGFCVPCEDGRLAIGCGRDLILLDPDRGETEVLMTVDQDQLENHFNDAKAIPGGRILAGTMNTAMDCEDVPGKETGRLLVLESGKEPVLITDGMKVPNGLAISPDHKTAYHVDTYNYRVDKYDFDEEAGVLQVEPEKGSPDGMTVAEDGSLFIAHWGGYAIRRYDPVTGEELVVYQLPVPIPTCCAFGGKDMDELYITTSSMDSSEEEYPLAGSVLVIKPGVKGIKPYRFKL